MDPVSIILVALAAGAAAAAKDTASQAVKDAYAGLKALVKKRFAGKPQAEIALTEYEKNEDTWQKPLQKSLVRISKGEQTTTLQEDALAKAVVVLLSSAHYVDPTVLLNAKVAEMPILGPLLKFVI